MSCVSNYCGRDVLLILNYTLCVVRANCVKGGDVCVIVNLHGGKFREKETPATHYQVK